MIDGMTIDQNKLTNYTEIVSRLKFAIKESSADQNKTISALMKFLSDYLETTKYQKEALDAQNFYFSKKLTESFIEIVRQNASLNSSTINKYVKTALDKLSLSDFFIDKNDVESLTKKISDSLKEILDAFQEKENKKEKESKPAISSVYIDKRVKKEIKKIDFISGLTTISAFIENNVFKNIQKAILDKKFTFASPYTAEKIKPKTNFLKDFTTKIWNPKISDLNRPFRNFERYMTYRLASKAKDEIKKAFNRFNGFLNTLFPFFIIGSVVKLGKTITKFSFAIASKITNIAVKTIFGTFSFVLSSIKRITGFATKIGTKTISVLAKVVKKISSFGLVKFTAKMLFGFMKSYVGAYLFGYAVGFLYGRIKGLIDFVKTVFEKVTKYFSDTKEWAEREIYDPYIKPIVEWFANRASEANFTIQQVESVFNDERFDGMSEKLKHALDLFTLQDSSGRRFTTQEINRRINGVEEALDMLSDFDLSNFLINAGGRMLGGIAGAKIGAIIGQALIPIPVLGGVIGALAGGWAGDALGGVIGKMITARSPYENVSSEESAIDEYIRTQLGYVSDIRREAMYGDMTAAPHMALLQQLGKMASRGTDISKILKSKEAKRLKQYGIDVEMSFGDGAGLRENLALFSDISKKLSYSKIVNEIRETVTNFQNVLDINGKEKPDYEPGNYKSVPRGALTIGTLKKYGKGYKTTEITLGDKTLPFPSYNNKFNPYWFKIFRNIVILNKLRDLQENRISIEDFVKTIKSISGSNVDLANFVTQIEGLEVKISDKNYDAKEVLFGTYFGKGTPLYEQEKNGARDAIFNRPGYLGLFNNLIAFFPQDLDWHIFSKRLMEPQNYTALITGNVSQIDRSAEFGESFSETYDRILREMVDRGQIEDVGNISKEDIAFRLSYQKIDPQTFENMSSDLQERLLRSTIENAITGNVGTLTEDLLKPVQDALSSISKSLSGSDFRSAFEQALKSMSQSNTLKMTLAEYQQLSSKNDKFYQETLIPALRDIINNEKDLTKRNELIAIFNLPPSLRSESRTYIDSSSTVSPNADL